MSDTYPIVTVRGDAQLQVPPDRANLSFTAHGRASSSAAVRDQLARVSVQLRGVLTEYADAVASSGTSRLHVSPVFGRSGAKITGYAGNLGASVEVADLDRLSDLVFALTPLPDAQVDGPWWSLTRDHPAHREVRLAAITDARTRAEDYAAAVGLGVGDLVEISDLETGGMPGPRMAMARGFAADTESAPSFDFEPAIQTVSGQVTVRYRLRK